MIEEMSRAKQVQKAKDKVFSLHASARFTETNLGTMRWQIVAGRPGSFRLLPLSRLFPMEEEDYAWIDAATRLKAEPKDEPVEFACACEGEFPQYCGPECDCFHHAKQVSPEARVETTEDRTTMYGNLLPTTKREQEAILKVASDLNLHPVTVALAYECKMRSTQVWGGHATQKMIQMVTNELEGVAPNPSMTCSKNTDGYHDWEPNTPLRDNSACTTCGVKAKDIMSGLEPAAEVEVAECSRCRRPIYNMSGYYRHTHDDSTVCGYANDWPYIQPYVKEVAPEAAGAALRMTSEEFQRLSQEHKQAIADAEIRVVSPELAIEVSPETIATTEYFNVPEEFRQWYERIYPIAYSAGYKHWQYALAAWDYLKSLNPEPKEEFRGSAPAEDQPLSVEVMDGCLIISIGIGTLAFSAQSQEPFNAYDERMGNWRDYWIIKDPLEFARDVRNEAGREEEDGSTPLTDFLDKVCAEALEQGCVGCEEAPTPEYEDEDDE